MVTITAFPSALVTAERAVFSLDTVWYGMDKVVAFAGLVLVGDSGEAVLEKLDPPRRAAVLMALLGLVLLGLVMVVCVMIGARWVRRTARYRPEALRSQTRAAAAVENLRLRESLASVLPEAKSDETIQPGMSPGETRVDL